MRFGGAEGGASAPSTYARILPWLLAYAPGMPWPRPPRWLASTSPRSRGLPTTSPSACWSEATSSRLCGSSAKSRVCSEPRRASCERSCLTRRGRRWAALKTLRSCPRLHPSLHRLQLALAKSQAPKAWMLLSCAAISGLVSLSPWLLGGLPASAWGCWLCAGTHGGWGGGWTWARQTIPSSLLRGGALSWSGIYVRAPNHLGDGVMARDLLLSLRPHCRELLVASPRWGSELYRDLDLQCIPRGEVPDCELGVLAPPPSAPPGRLGGSLVGSATAGTLAACPSATPSADGQDTDETSTRTLEPLGIPEQKAPAYQPTEEERARADVPQGHPALNPLSPSGPPVMWGGYETLGQALSASGGDVRWSRDQLSTAHPSRIGQPRRARCLAGARSGHGLERLRSGSTCSGRGHPDPRPLRKHRSWGDGPGRLTPWRGLISPAAPAIASAAPTRVPCLAISVERRRP